MRDPNGSDYGGEALADHAATPRPMAASMTSGRSVSRRKGHACAGSHRDVMTSVSRGFEVPSDGVPRGAFCQCVSIRESNVGNRRVGELGVFSWCVYVDVIGVGRQSSDSCVPRDESRPRQV